jgi:hypothetical protein
MQVVGGLNSVLSNWQGIKTGEGQGFSKFMGAYSLGTLSGTCDWANLMTNGAFHKPLAKANAGATGLSHNTSFGKEWDDPEAYEVSYRVLSQMYAYGVRGSMTKVGSDLTWSTHIMAEEPLVKMSNNNRYLESRNRFHYMKMKMEMDPQGDYYNHTNAGNNRDNGKKNYNYYGHWFFGRAMGPKLYYYGFEVWGEPYTQWEEDDYYDDGNHSGKPMDGPYDSRW